MQCDPILFFLLNSI